MPRRRGFRIVRGGVFFFKVASSLTRSVAPPFQITAAAMGVIWFWNALCPEHIPEASAHKEESPEILDSEGFQGFLLL